MEQKRKSSVDWERDIYAKGNQVNRWPFDKVISSIMHATSDRDRHEVSVLEIGCGAGNNIWFLAAEGFRAHGIDMSGTVINYARNRLHELGLQAELQVGDIADLPWQDHIFDFVIDRGTLTQNTHEHCGKIIKEARRTLKPMGIMLSFDLFGMNHPERLFGDEVSHHTFDNFRNGYFRSVGLTSFFTKQDLRVVFGSFSKANITRTTVQDEEDRILSEVFTVTALK
jgi:ubiquinone/menaquinone biosynthesis C-methylase UbiE